MKVTRKQIAPNMWQTTVEEPTDALLALCWRSKITTKRGDKEKTIQRRRIRKDLKPWI